VLGAASVALAIFPILEFNKPYTSSIRVSPVAFEQAIVQLDQPGAANPSSAARGRSRALSLNGSRATAYYFGAHIHAISGDAAIAGTLQAGRYASARSIS
jgi:hypothetical protein